MTPEARHVRRPSFLAISTLVDYSDGLKGGVPVLGVS